MKTLIVYYSRTGNTDKIARMLQEKLNCDIERITDNGKYKGTLGFIKGGFNAVSGRGTTINQCSKNPEEYDLIIIGTPIWAGTIAVPVNTYIMQNKENFKRKLACFTTCKSSGYEETIKELSKICEKSLSATLSITEADLNNPSEKINTFINKIKN